MTVIIPKNYRSSLGVYDTQTAIGDIKKWFEEALSGSLKLKRVSAPLFVQEDSGLNDELSGVEKPVSFQVPALKARGEVVHSLAKWKRMALYRYDFRVNNGIYTDMNAIRRDEILSNIHSIYVDQWDWERVISKEQRNTKYLKEVVQSIVSAIFETSSRLHTKYPQVDLIIDPNVSFITSQQLEDLYPHLTPKERENTYVKKHNTTFILEIGEKLKSGKPHDNRAADYDDWKLNGDLLFWHKPLNMAIEISSMGIRVDAESMYNQLKKTDNLDKIKYDFHRKVIDNSLPYTIGGGIGQSRMCMLLLQKAHIGEVQVSLWDAETIDKCFKKINLL